MKTTINVILFYDKKHITISIITPSPSPVKKNENKHSQTKRPCTLIDSESLNEKHFHGGSGIKKKWITNCVLEPMWEKSVYAEWP